jgi:hypothetical protein
MRHANKFGLPIVTFVDTPGAYAGRAAEELGQVRRMRWAAATPAAAAAGRQQQPATRQREEQRQRWQRQRPGGLGRGLGTEPGAACHLWVHPPPPRPKLWSDSNAIPHRQPQAAPSLAGPPTPRHPRARLSPTTCAKCLGCACPSSPSSSARAAAAARSRSAAPTATSSWRTASTTSPRPRRAPLSSGRAATRRRRCAAREAAGSRWGLWGGAPPAPRRRPPRSPPGARAAEPRARLKPQAARPPPPAPPPQATEALRITAPELVRLGVMDTIVPEPLGGAHADPVSAFPAIRDAIMATFREYETMSEREIQLDRWGRGGGGGGGAWGGGRSAERAAEHEPPVAARRRGAQARPGPAPALPPRERQAEGAARPRLACSACLQIWARRAPRELGRFD